MKNLTEEQKLRMINKLLNTFVKPRFPEIDKIIVTEEIPEYFGGWYKIEVIVDGIEYDQELLIDNEIEHILQYTGFGKLKYNLNFTTL